MSGLACLATSCVSGDVPSRRPADAQVLGGRGRRRGWSAVAGLLVALVLTAVLAAGAQAAVVSLGSAERFAVLAGSTVTNTGPSVISGDLGVSPGTAVTGFPPGTVTAGTIHGADAVAAQAQSDLVSAYNDAAARSATAAISADLAGSTLTPGVYTSPSSLGLSGTLTLDGGGDPNAVFVFQARSTLTTGPGSRVVLTGAAQACNVFWQVGSSATIGTSSTFAGTVLALTSITLTTGATLTGRALARNGAVTLDTNTITSPACTAPVPTAPSGTPAPADTTGASAQLRGPRRCVDHAFRARVSGRQISRVTFFVDAKRRQTINATTGQTSFSLRINPARQSLGAHRITAKVRFTDNAAKARTLRLVYQRCSKAAVRPRFTG